MISSFRDVLAYLRSTGRALEIHPDAKDRVRFKAGAIWLELTAIPFRGPGWLRLTAPLGPSERIKPRPALVASGAFPVGALALGPKQAVLRQTLPLAALPEAQLERTISGLAAVAADLRAAAASIARDPAVEVTYGYVFR